jgi:TRAP transporter TAXI family solute receptor
MMSGLLQASRLCASVGVLLTTLMAGPALAQNRTGAAVPNKPDLGTIGERINANTIAVVSGNVNGTYLSIAYDLSAVLDNGDDFRVLPVIGKGGGQNVKDVRFLKGIDLGITQSAVLNAFRRTNEIGAFDDKIVYLTKLFDEEMHIVVRADSGISMIDQLAGRKVNLNEAGSGTQLSGREIFAKLEIPIQEMNYGQADALEKLKSGEIAAAILIAGKPTAGVTRVRTADGFRILPVPYRKSLQTDYLPATLTSTDYPGLIEPGQTVDTVAVAAVLVAFNWPKGSDRYRRIQTFVDNFFPRLGEFQKPPRHPKWREINLAATVPGWKRFEGAEEWLRKQQQPGQQPGQLQAQQREQFDRFLAARSSMKPVQTPADRDQLFKEFIQWSSSRERR